MKSKRNRSKTILYSTLSIIVVLIFLLLILKPTKKEMVETKELAVSVSTEEVHLTNTVDIVYLPAVIKANVSAILSAEKAGRVVELMVNRGDKISKNQQLLQVDDRIWQTSLQQAKISASDAKKNLERFNTLQESGAVAASKFDLVEKEYITAKSLLEQAHINIEQCRVISPIDGVVNDRFVEEGEYVQPGVPLFQIVDYAKVKVQIQIPEKDIFAIKIGANIQFTIQPIPNQTFTGKVVFIAPQANEQNNAFRAELEVDNRNNILRPGMIAQVKFIRGTNEGMVSLPMSAVLPSKGDHIVYLVKNNHAVRRKVQIEKITRERALISNGLEAGDIVVIEGSRTLSDGQLVNPVNSDAI